MKRYILTFFVLSILNYFIYSQQERLRIIGEFFGDYYYKVQADTGILLKGSETFQNLEKNSNAFNIRRFNIGFDYKLNTNLTGTLLLEGNEDFTVNSNKTRSVYIKFANLTWENIIKNVNITFGAQRTPTFTIISEKIWGYRSVEKAITDFRKYLSSSDVGFSIYGKINPMINYYLMIGNGEGTKIENNIFKKIYSSIYGTILNNKVTYQINYDFEKKSNYESASLFKFFSVYQHKKFAIGIEPYLYILEDTTTNKDFGFTTFIKNVLIEDKLNSFIRFDYYNNNFNKNINGYKELLLLAGIDIKPGKENDKKISIIPNLWSMFYLKKTENMINRKPDIILRLTMHYKI